MNRVAPLASPGGTTAVVRATASVADASPAAIAAVTPSGVVDVATGAAIAVRGDDVARFRPSRPTRVRVRCLPAPYPADEPLLP